ncbi:MAG: (4Fe-4S)-binding protein [Gracilibacter sp. BRH_c7a]|nr:MAG: (4Fe-4S)-binding protein [Gracilibacter sp. BRH_c7a]KUO65101.1 MAG: (4Fe-4S)-binding protein [Gracilibacter sp. BRH_c7a]
MELTVISGKGGTGKTSIAVAIAELERNTVKVDCDVDAPNFYLYYDGNDASCEDFSGGKKVVVDEELCISCGLCQDACQFSAIENGLVDFLNCEGCGACVLVCPTQAASLKEEKTADIFVTDTGKGILSRAEVEIGSEGSGKLITILRKAAKPYTDGKITVSDGSPGIGCPVISSITGTDAVLIVTEPTQSGMEDLGRVVTLCRQFKILIFVCINKVDINKQISTEIEEYCLEKNLLLAGRIPYDDTVLRSINELKPIIFYSESPANEAIRQMWKTIKKEIFKD